LAKRGVEVEIFEASPSLGGLAGQITLDDGTAIDRFYHAILSSDSYVRNLCDELGLADDLRFMETRTGFYHDGQIHPMNNTADFLRFPLLGWLERFRLGLTVLRAQLVRDWEELESISVQDWLLRWSGKKTYEAIWRPLLNAKFDGGFDSIPATYIWSRLVRMKSARNGAQQKELVGHLVGSHIQLINAMAECIERSGGLIHLNSPVQEIMIEGGRAWGLRNGTTAQTYDSVVCTLPAPIFRRLIPEAQTAYKEFLDQIEYLGVVSTILVMDRPLSGYWTLNITDSGTPFTGVIETTTYIDPQYVGDHHLVYLPKYTSPGSELQKQPNEEIERMWLESLERMFPKFDRSHVRYMLTHRERYVEPIHGLNGLDQIPPITTPVESLYLATTAQIYPELTHAESLARHAQSAAEIVLEQQVGTPSQPVDHILEDALRESVIEQNV
jgi:protoporphyrinogen oxidase